MKKWQQWSLSWISACAGLIAAVLTVVIAVDNVGGETVGLLFIGLGMFVTLVCQLFLFVRGERRQTKEDAALRLSLDYITTVEKEAFDKITLKKTLAFNMVIEQISCAVNEEILQREHREALGRLVWTNKHLIGNAYNALRSPGQEQAFAHWTGEFRYQIAREVGMLWCPMNTEGWGCLIETLHELVRRPYDHQGTKAAAAAFNAALSH